MMMKLAFLFFSSALAAEPKLLGAQTRPGSFWNQWPGLSSTPSECQVEPGTMVPDTCCTAEAELPLRSDFTADTCSMLVGLLPDDPSLGLVNYLNCEGGEEVYAEGCYEGGANGGIVPAGGYESNNATTVDECGTKPPCSFIIRGKGCWKIRDTSDLPGYEDDPAVVFLWMDIPTCEVEEEPTPEPTSGPTSAGGSVSGHVVFLFAGIFALFL